MTSARTSVHDEPWSDADPWSAATSSLVPPTDLAIGTRGWVTTDDGSRDTTEGRFGRVTDEKTFTELLPVGGRVIEPLPHVAEESRLATDDRPWVYANMVTSLDGAVAIDGVSGGLGNLADQAMFSALRAVADVIVVGATTAIDENYRPPTNRHREARLARGQAERPTIAIITRSLAIKPEHRVFSDPSARPIIITVKNAPASRRAKLDTVADVLDAGDDDVDFGVALRLLRHRGFERALLEGGPSINGQFAANDLIDEWNLSLSPLLAAGKSGRAAHGPSISDPRKLSLVRLWLGDGMLFGRWVRSE